MSLGGFEAILGGFGAIVVPFWVALGGFGAILGPFWSHWGGGFGGVFMGGGDLGFLGLTII